MIGSKPKLSRKPYFIFNDRSGGPVWLLVNAGLSSHFLRLVSLIGIKRGTGIAEVKSSNLVQLPLSCNCKSWVWNYDNRDSLHLIPCPAVLKYKFHVFMVSLNRLFVGEMASFFSFSLFICRAILLSSNLSVIFPNFANSAVQKGCWLWDYCLSFF